MVIGYEVVKRQYWYISEWVKRSGQYRPLEKQHFIFIVIISWTNLQALTGVCLYTIRYHPYITVDRGYPILISWLVVPGVPIEPFKHIYIYSFGYFCGNGYSFFHEILTHFYSFLNVCHHENPKFSSCCFGHKKDLCSELVLLKQARNTC